MNQSIDQPSASYHVPSLRKPRPAVWGVLWRWTALTSLGLFIAAIVIGTIVGLLFGVETQMSDGVFMIMLAIMAALPVGLCQWIFLYRRAKVSAWWIGATAAGVAVSVLLIIMLLKPLQEQLWQGGARLNDANWSILAWGMSGAIIGFGQWLVLRQALARAAWWIGASTAAAMLVGAMDVMPSPDYRHVAAYCLVTGVALSILLTQPRVETSQS